MMAEDGKRGLGRGIMSLLGEAGDDAPPPAAGERGRAQRRVPIEFLRPNPRNPRKQFREDELGELSESIRERGVIQPIVVRSVDGGADAYEIIAGERRWRAAQKAGLHQVPIVVIEASDRDSLEFAIIENVQRADLNPIEEAAGYQSLMEQFDYSQDAIAKIVGKSRPHVANMLRLLKLSEPVKAYVRSGKLTAGHARLLVGQPNAEELASEIIDRGLNVRQVEAWSRRDGAKQVKDLRAENRKPRAGSKDPNTAALEKRVSDALGLQVSVDHKGDWGTLQIYYRSLEQLEDVLRRLERPT
jgi:ParB family chromosome partitioning protein